MFNGFSTEDFQVFHVPGLEERMKSLVATVRPKLHAIGEQLCPILSVQCGAPMYAHVAKHARRSVNPPDDTWVAWSANKRGYKSSPHFQVGMWSTHVFIQFTIIYECINKQNFAITLEETYQSLQQMAPDHFYWSTDHTKPDVYSIADSNLEQFRSIIQKLKHQKKSEFLCGLSVAKDDPRLGDAGIFIELAEDTFERLMPLYRLAFS